MSTPVPPPISVVDYDVDGAIDMSASPSLKAALVVIDMQNDFVSGSLAVPDGASVIEPINKLIELPFTLRIATRDFHPDNHVSFAATHGEPPLSKKVIFHPEDKDLGAGIEHVLWPKHCVADTNGAEFVPTLTTTKFDAVLHKGTHPHIESYSAFRDIWNRSVSELPGLLDAKGVTDVYFVGLAGDYCVKYSAYDSVEFGYKTWVIEDGIRCIATDNSTEEGLKKRGVKFTTSKEVGKLFGIEL